MLKLSIRQVLPLVILLLAVSAIITILVIYPVYGADFYYVFYPTGQAVWGGQWAIYTPDNGFINPAHAMYYFMLLALAPLPLANALQMLVSVGLSMTSMQLWRKYSRWDLLVVILALANPYTVDLLLRGQIDGIALFGLILGFVGAKEKHPHLLGLGATISMVKPTNLFLPLLLIAWSLRVWHWREILKAAVIPLLTILTTLMVFGFDWPLLYFDRITPSIPINELTSQTIWKLAEYAGLPQFVPMLIAGALLLGVLKHRELEPQNFALAITTSFLVTNYAAGYHYVTLIPAIMCIRSRSWVVLCWLLSFLTFFRAISFNYSWLSLLYPIAVCMALLWQAAQDEKQKMKSL